MVLSIMVPHFPVVGSRGGPPVPPTILMSELKMPPNWCHNHHSLNHCVMHLQDSTHVMILTYMDFVKRLIQDYEGS